MNRINLLTILLAFFLAWTAPLALAADERPHGLEPADDMPYIPDLSGLRHRSYKNQYGQERHLSEAVVLRRSTIDKGVATVPAGGLYYISEVEEEVRPLVRDPFFILGEQGYLLTLKTHKQILKNVSIDRGDKILVDDMGYRLWFDYSTDHYMIPYAQMALIAPSGHWPLEFSVATDFVPMHEVVNEKLSEGINDKQLYNFYLDPIYEYGASHFSASKVGFDNVVFDEIAYPVIDEAMFSLTRPWTLELRQEDFRWYYNKRIYAFRQPNGFLVRVTDWTGKNVLGEKLVRPATPQGYKDREDVQGDYYLSLPEQDMHVEIMIDPQWSKNSDFVPFSEEVPYGWPQGVLSFVVYSNLIKVENGKPWPLDERYLTRLEANQLTGKLQRMTLENAEAFTLSNDNDTHRGPTKFSHFWNRPYFKLVANGFDDNKVFNYYLRDYFFERTDNLSFDEKRGRRDIDFFIGRAPTLIPILEDTFLTRFADSKTFGQVTEGSHFDSYPDVVSDAAFDGPDHTAPFVALMRGFQRKDSENRRGERLISTEGLVIRKSYVDYDNKQIVIPPAGMYYTSRNGRNVRALTGETTFYFGKQTWLASFKSSTIARKNFDMDFWRKQPTGGLNTIFWQDELIGAQNKGLRFGNHVYLDDRPMVELRVMKYSGNPFGAPFFIAQGLDKSDPDTRYGIPELFAEGATYTIPEYVGPNYVRMKEMGTPIMNQVWMTQTEPKNAMLGVGESAKLGNYTVQVDAMDEFAKTVTLSIKDKSGVTVATEFLGPLDQATIDVLPQHQEAVNRLQLMHGDVMAEMDILKPFEGGKASIWTYADVFMLETNKPLESDPRFILRLDVCGHCYQLNEILIDNAEAIILDADNPVYDGPKGPDGEPLFKVAVHDFDGEMIHDWRIETVFKGRTFETDNLAFYPRKNLDVLVGAVGTTESFLRMSMVERMANIEYWRRAIHPPKHVGLEKWHALGLQ